MKYSNIEDLLSINVFGYAKYQNSKQVIGRLKELRKFKEFMDAIENKIGMG